MRANNTPTLPRQQGSTNGKCWDGLQTDRRLLLQEEEQPGEHPTEQEGGASVTSIQNKRMQAETRETGRTTQTEVKEERPQERLQSELKVLPSGKNKRKASMLRAFMMKQTDVSLFVKEDK